MTTASATGRGALTGATIWLGKIAVGTWVKLALPEAWSGMATETTGGASWAAEAGGRW